MEMAQISMYEQRSYKREKDKQQSTNATAVDASAYIYDKTARGLGVFLLLIRLFEHGYEQIV